MILTRTVAPAEEPITLTQARNWCGFQSGVTQDDDRITELISEIRFYLEERTHHRKIITQTWTVGLDAVEVSSWINIPLVPLQSVTSIVVTDSAGDATAVDSSNYQVRAGENPRIVLSPTGSWPAMRPYDSMVITAVVGYGLQADIPEDLVMLLKGLVQHQYRSKGFGVSETVSGQIIGVPQMFERQIQGYTVNLWG